FVDRLRRVTAWPAVGAAREHHVGPVAAEGSHAGQHVNIVVGRAAGAVNYQEDLPRKTAWIYRAAVNQAAAHVNGGDLVKSRRHSRVPRVGRADTPKAATTIPTANEEVAVGSHVECSPLRRVGNTDRTLPGDSAIGGATESAEVASEEFGPKLVLKAVTHAGGCPINREPFLVAAVRASVG